MTMPTLCNGYTEKVNKDTGELLGVVKTTYFPNMVTRNVSVPPGNFPLTDQQIKGKLSKGEMVWVQFENFDVAKAWNNYDNPQYPGFSFRADRAGDATGLKARGSVPGPAAVRRRVHS